MAQPIVGLSLFALPYVASGETQTTITELPLLNPDSLDHTYTYQSTDEGETLTIVTVDDAYMKDELSGSLTVYNGTETAHYEPYSVTLLSIGKDLTLNGANLYLKQYGPSNDIDYSDAYGIQIASEKTVSFIDTTLEIDTEVAHSLTFVYGIKDGNIGTFDAGSRVTVTSTDTDVSQLYAIYSSSIENFAGKVSISSKTEGIGIYIDQATATTFASTAEVTVDATESAVGAVIYSTANTKIDGTFTAKMTGSDKGVAVGAELYGAFDEIKGSYTANGTDSSDIIALVNGGMSQSIDATIRTTTTGTGFSAATVGYLGYVGIQIGGEGVGFDTFNADILATGNSSAVGMELNHIHLSTPVFNSSGTIAGTIAALTDDTYFVNFNADGNFVEVASDEFHFKSTAAIRVVQEQSEEASYMAQPDADQVSELNFADGTVVKAWVVAEGKDQGGRYGDALQFTVDELIVNAAPNATVTLEGDITSAAIGMGIHSAGGGDKRMAAEEGGGWTSAPIGTKRTITFNEGTYDVSSDYWFVTQVNVGSAATRGTGTILLSDSTQFSDTTSMSFHVNSANDYSSIVVSAEEVLTISDMNTITITLGEAIMATPIFEVDLIVGNIADMLDGELFFKLTDLNDTGTGLPHDDLSSIYIIYNGEKVFYTDGMSIQMDGTSSDLTIGRMIPEPSTASLSLIALAGMLARRRRRKAA